MSARDRELDETLARARATVDASEKLIGNAEAAREEFAAWQEENGVGGDVVKKVFAALPEEDRKRAEAEREAFDRELRHDLDAAVAQARPAPPQGKARPRRSYV